MTEIPFRVTPDKGPQAFESAAIGIDHERHIDTGVLRVIGPAGTGEKEQAVALTVPQRVIDKQGHVIDARFRLTNEPGHFAERNQQRCLAGFDVHLENTIVAGM